MKIKELKKGDEFYYLRNKYVVLEVCLPTSMHAQNVKTKQSINLFPDIEVRLACLTKDKPCTCIKH